jgi:hypothetical protein
MYKKYYIVIDDCNVWQRFREPAPRSARTASENRAEGLREVGLELRAPFLISSVLEQRRCAERLLPVARDADAAAPTSLAPGCFRVDPGRRVTGPESLGSWPMT